MTLLDQLLTTIAAGADPGPFALVRREDATEIEIFAGTAHSVDRLADIPLPPGPPGPRTLALVPYRQVAERGFACVDDGAPLECLAVSAHHRVPLDAALAALPAGPVAATAGGFDISDTEYAGIGARILREEIGRGEGANFVIHRTFESMVAGPALMAALAALRRLLTGERGAYWTFLVHTGARTLVGATPERHVSVEDGLAMMNPISGTFRHPDGPPDTDALLAFLADPKEIDELYMVLDEELKMMARVAEHGGQVVGPYLKEMSHLAHIEYLLAGRGSLDVRDVLRETMFAPTVTGSPMENACRVIARHERRGRGYYAGVLAALGLRPPAARPAGEPVVRLADDPAVRAALAARNDGLAWFWLEQRDEGAAVPPHLAGRQVLIVDGEDTFTGMLAHQLRALGLAVTVRPWHEPAEVDGFDLVVVGPGPGDPTSTDAKIVAMRARLAALLAAGRPTLAVCLGHQLLSGLLGLRIRRREAPYQGLQREIDLFGAARRVGFYSTFTAVSEADQVHTPYGPVRVARDAIDGSVHGLRGFAFAGVQFHPESVLSPDGIVVLADLVTHLLAAPPDAALTGPAPNTCHDRG